jgi:oligopeptidase B
MGISKSLDGKYLFVEASSKETSDLEDPAATLQSIAKRRLKVLCDVEHRNGQWWIMSNIGGLPNMALWKAPDRQQRTVRILGKQ